MQDRLTMENFHIEPVFPPDLPEVAGFILKQRAGETETSLDRRMGTEDTAGIERRLRWLLLDSPAARPAEPLGYCLRDRIGAIRGLNLCFPAPFLVGQKKILGLGSGSFFVDPEARTLGFYLFRKYLACPGYAFYFATTCNAASAQLWSQLGGIPVRRSQTAYRIPLRLESVIARRIASIIPGKTATKIARFGGRCAGSLLSLAVRSATEVAVSPCRDWDKLADLSRRHRPDNTIMSERSAELLQWRFGPASPAHSCGVYLTRDSLGNEGWFAVSDSAAQVDGKWQVCTLLDAIWPREFMNFGDFVYAVTQTAADSAEGVLVRCRLDLDWTDGRHWILRQKLPAPRAYVVVPEGAPAITTNLLDYNDNDYVAWS